MANGGKEEEDAPHIPRILSPLLKDRILPLTEETSATASSAAAAVASCSGRGISGGGGGGRLEEDESPNHFFGIADFTSGAESGFVGRKEDPL